MIVNSYKVLVGRKVMKRLIWLMLLWGVSAWATVANVAYTVTYTCAGGYGPFAFTFPISDPTALAVTMNGTLLSSTDYTVTPVNNNYSNGGSVTLASTSPCTTGWSIVLTRVTPVTQTLRFYDNMPIPMTTFERGLDKLTEIAQELANMAVGTTSVQMQNNGLDYLSPAAGAIVLNFANCTVTGTQGNYTITCLGGGGSAPSGAPNDVQLYGTSTTLNSDTGVFYHNPTTHTTYTGTANVSQELDVSDPAHSGVTHLGSSNGATIHNSVDLGVTDTLSADYGLCPPDTVPPDKDYHWSIESNTPTTPTWLNGGTCYPGKWVLDVAVPGNAGSVVCWKTATTLSYCEDQPDSSGNCTCH